MKAKMLLWIGAVAASLCAAGLIGAEPAGGGEPGWTPRIVTLGAERERVNSLEIAERPYRPFHFYGNTLRRLYYRGNPLPTLEDWNNTWRSVLRRPE